MSGEFALDMLSPQFYDPSSMRLSLHNVVKTARLTFSPGKR